MPAPWTAEDVVMALTRQHPEAIPMLREFVEASRDPDALLRPEGPSLLRIAVEHLHLEAVEELVKSGADLNMRSGPEGWTALHHAVDIDVDSVLQSNPNRQHLEPHMFTFEATRLLLRLGASAEAVDSTGQTARDLAASYQLGELFDQIASST